MSWASRKSFPRNSLRGRGGSMRVDPWPAGFPVKVTLTTLPAKRHSTNSARAGVHPSSFASSKVQRSNRVPSGLIWRRRSEEHTSELQSRPHLVCRLLLEKKKKRYVGED